MSYLSILNDIKSLKIQGARNVAIAGIEALDIVVTKIIKSNISLKKAKKEIERSVKEISSLRSTEPMLRNFLYLVTNNLNYSSYYSLNKDFHLRVSNLLKHAETSKKKIVEYGSKKIKKGMTIFTHCHSSTVTSIIINSGKKVLVCNTETRPLFQGRITAKELSKNNIHVEHFVDGAGKIAIKKSDIVLLGADAITVDGVYNKIGSDMFAMIAKHYDVPVYICADSLKYDFKGEFGFEEIIEMRHQSEVWKDKPKNVHINNYAFEKISFSNVSAIISELGVLPPQVFIERVREKFKSFQ